PAGRRRLPAPPPRPELPRRESPARPAPQGQAGLVGPVRPPVDGRQPAVAAEPRRPGFGSPPHAGRPALRDGEDGGIARRRDGRPPPPRPAVRRLPRRSPAPGTGMEEYDRPDVRGTTPPLHAAARHRQARRARRDFGQSGPTHARRAAGDAVAPHPP